MLPPKRKEIAAGLVTYNPDFSRLEECISSIQCFEAAKGKTIWRFACESAQDVLNAHLTDTHNEPLEATFVDIGFVGDSRRMSVVINDSVREFNVFIGEDVCYRVTLDMVQSLINYRDKSMVNPGIARAYRLLSRLNAIVPRVNLPVKAAPEDPLISIVVPLFHTPANYLHAAIDSVRAQTYGKWELVLVNATPDADEIRKVLDTYQDSRIREIKLDDNYGIAGNTNRGIAEARGDYVAFLDHDDVLDPHALEAYAKRIEQDPTLDVLYCDEDNFHESLHDCFMPIFKPDLNLDLLLSHNYIVHFLMVSKRVIQATPRSDDAVSGAQDYDLLLQAIDYAGRCAHIPQVLYHWRAHEGSTNGGERGAKPYASDACIEVLKRYFGRHNLAPEIECTQVPYHYRVLHHVQANDAVSLVLWGQTKAHLELRAKDLQEKLHSTIAETLCCTGPLCEVVKAAAEAAQGTHLVFVDTNIENITAQTIDLLVGYTHVPGAGIVAPKMVYADGLVAHAGLVVYNDKLVPINQNFTNCMGGGYLGMAECSCAYSATWPDCFAVNKEIAREALNYWHNLDNSHVAMADLCFAIRTLGRRVVVIPDEPVVYRANGENDLVHYDGADAALLWKYWDEQWQKDINHNPHVECSSGYPRLDEATNGTLITRNALHAARKLKKVISR